MVSSDKRLEVVEDELKLLKGEVKRTLVDLRAFIMREDSPLNERLIVTRDPIRDRGDQLGGELSQVTANVGNSESDKRVEALEEEMRVLRSERARAESTPPPMPNPQPSPPVTPWYPPPATPGYGAPYQQQQPPGFGERPVPPPTQGAQDPSGDIRFSNAQFENTRFVGQPDQPSASDVEEHQSQDNEDYPPQEPQGRRRQREQPEKVSSELSDDPPEKGRHHPAIEPPRTQERTPSDVEEHQWQNNGSYSPQETRGRSRRREQPEEVSSDFSDDPPENGRHYPTKGPPRTQERTPSDVEEHQWQNNGSYSPQGRRRRQEQPEEVSSDFSDDPPENGRHYPTKEPPRTQERRNGHRSEFEEIKEDDWSPSHPSNGGSSREPAMGQDALDVNLIANLVRWAFQAKKHMGQDRLLDFLDLYLWTGHHSEELKVLISYMCDIVEEGPSYEANGPAQDCVDLIHQLHGILAGGMPLTYKSRVKFSAGERADKVEEPAMSESKGTFTREV